jgi:hypothetical protein
MGLEGRRRAPRAGARTFIVPLKIGVPMGEGGDTAIGEADLVQARVHAHRLCKGMRGREQPEDSHTDRRF